MFNLTVLAGLSLLLCIGLGCVWERSMRVAEGLEYSGSSGQTVILGTFPRRFYFFVYISWGAVRNVPTGWNYSSGQRNPRDVDTLLAMFWEDWRLGFRLYRETRTYQDRGRQVTTVVIPLWFPMVLTLVLPLCWRRQGRRARLGLCLQCGYDLRATPDATGPRLPRCPECGREA